MKKKKEKLAFLVCIAVDVLAAVVECHCYGWQSVNDNFTSCLILHLTTFSPLSLSKFPFLRFLSLWFTPSFCSLTKTITLVLLSSSLQALHTKSSKPPSWSSTREKDGRKRMIRESQTRRKSKANRMVSPILEQSPSLVNIEDGKKNVLQLEYHWYTWNWA